MATGGTADAQRWQIAISLVAAWRDAPDERRAEAVAERLAAVAAEGGPAAVEQAALGLAGVAGMFLELYADCAGRSLDSILADAAAVGEAGSPATAERDGPAAECDAPAAECDGPAANEPDGSNG